MSLGALLYWSYTKYYAGCGGKCVCGSACTCGPTCSCEGKASSKEGNVVNKGCSMNNGGTCSCTQESCKCSPVSRLFAIASTANAVND